MCTGTSQPNPLAAALAGSSIQRWMHEPSTSVRVSMSHAPKRRQRAQTVATSIRRKRNFRPPLINDEPRKTQDPTRLDQRKMIGVDNKVGAIQTAHAGSKRTFTTSAAVTTAVVAPNMHAM